MSHGTRHVRDIHDAAIGGLQFQDVVCRDVHVLDDPRGTQGRLGRHRDGLLLSPLNSLCVQCALIRKTAYLSDD